MSRYGDKHVIVRGVIMWDGITRPEAKDDGKGGKRTQYSIKVAVAQAQQAELGELTAIATDALNNDTTFKGRLPAGGCWPILPVDAMDFEGRLPAHVAFNAKTYRIPQVFDANNQEIAPMIYQQMLYPGCIVEALVSAFAFTNVSKGIALSLDGLRIIDATAPRLPVGGVDAGAAFGGGAMPGGQPAPAAYAPPPVAGYVPPNAVPPAAYTPPPAGALPAVGLPAGVAPAPDFLAPPPVGAPPVAPAAPVSRMTAKAAGQTYEAFRTAGWTDQQLIDNGYMI